MNVFPFLSPKDHIILLTSFIKKKKKFHDTTENMILRIRGITSSTFFQNPSESSLLKVPLIKLLILPLSSLKFLLFKFFP